MRNLLQGQGRRPAISGINRRNTLSILSPASDRRDESDVEIAKKLPFSDSLLGACPRMG